jgi:hypothetical protein
MSALCIGVAIDPDVVGRIEEDRIDSLLPNHGAQEVRVAGIATAYPVVADLPDVSLSRLGLRRDDWDHLVSRIRFVRQITSISPVENPVSVRSRST